MQNMISDAGEIEVIEVGPGKVLQGLFKKVDRSIQTSSATFKLTNYYLKAVFDELVGEKWATWKHNLSFLDVVHDDNHFQ